jgi:cysteine desulfurase / selenocysteine lyase
MSYKSNFPIFLNHPDLVYLDNASTTQKPSLVIDSLVEFYSNFNANVHRGIYPLSEKATELYEAARKKVAALINAYPDEIIFTSGTTGGVNGIVQSLTSSSILTSNTRILLSDAEHHSNILPWQKVSGAKISFAKLQGNFVPKIPEEEYDIVSMSYISNVTGAILPVNEILNRQNRAIKIFDLAQAVGHMKVDIKELAADFAVFSGHKMFGPTGVGVLFIRRGLQPTLEPFNFGGGMIREVQKDSATWAEAPEKYEAGTPAIAEAFALGTAVDYINSIGFEKIRSHEGSLRKYLIQELQGVPNIEIYHPDLSIEASGVVSFCISGVHPHDIAQFLGEHNICVRAGHHCTQILHREVFEIPASVRVSLAIYNTEEDIENFIQNLKSALNIYKK